jgi:hypothetical protein
MHLKLDLFSTSTWEGGYLKGEVTTQTIISSLFFFFFFFFFFILALIEKKMTSIEGYAPKVLKALTFIV